MGEALLQQVPRTAAKTAGKVAGKTTQKIPPGAEKAPRTPGNAVNGHDSSLRDSVSNAVQAYLQQLDGQTGSAIYPMVLAEMEAPLLQAIMQYTHNNQTLASHMLGLNRGTLRKKLKQYGLLERRGGA